MSWTEENEKTDQARNKILRLAEALGMLEFQLANTADLKQLEVSLRHAADEVAHLIEGENHAADEVAHLIEGENHAADEVAHLIEGENHAAIEH